ENDIGPDSVIALYVVAPVDSNLSGNQIYTALTSLGFKLGDMDIFHHYGLGQLKSDRPLFSLANMYEPGYFDVKAMDTMSTRGLSIFVCLPSQHNAEEVFAFMLEITRRLAKKLDALVLGPDRKELTQKTLDDIAAQLKQHER
ncbi:MAG: cell division protein ZipA C-terminal FtsZ-binding domain-containing protein, partial [Gammaproteobacteria bacterium]